jgi:hypothetical protein
MLANKLGEVGRDDCSIIAISGSQPLTNIVMLPEFWVEAVV